MTKAPFNALAPITDLNNALVSFALCSYSLWLSSAGYLGPKYKVDHDISLLIPEIWSRMRSKERNVGYLIDHNMLERCKDMEFDSKPVLSSRLGWRITKEFVIAYFGRVFSSPASIFTEDMLKPELQDMKIFADSMSNMVGAHKRAAEAYFADGTIEGACPPLKALLYIMRDGNYEGKTLADESIRKLFEREEILKSEWYVERLMARQQIDVNSLQKMIAQLQANMSNSSNPVILKKMTQDLLEANGKLKSIKTLNSLKSLAGTIGVDPYIYQ